MYVPNDIYVHVVFTVGFRLKYKICMYTYICFYHMYCFARGLSIGNVRASEFSVKVCNFATNQIKKTGIVFY